MVFADSLTKAGKLVELQRLFWRNPRRRMTSAELADRLGIASRTVRKYLAEMSASGCLPIIYEKRAWALAEGARLEVLPVRFLVEEAAAVYLAARLLGASADEPNPAVGTALGKLAGVMPAEARPFFERLSERNVTLQESPFSKVFRTLAYAWTLGRVVELEYAPRTHDGRPYACRFEPYLLEPAAVGSAIYAVGRAIPPDAIRVLKLERIRAATLTEGTFEAPPADALLDRLDAAWGVWMSEESPVEVALAFTPEVAGRVRETRWHPSQRLEAAPGGALRMTLTVASTVELLPWILGWGRHCEVLSPPALRDEVAAEHRAALRGDEPVAEQPRGP
jgi:predicted DNA-binding transcriptional regulator YafY